MVKKEIMNTANVSLMKELGVSPEDIKKYQKAYVEQVAIGTLEKLLARLKKKEYVKIRDDMLQYSPAGDDMGMDTMFIDFSACFPYSEDSSDLGDVLNFLSK